MAELVQNLGPAGLFGALALGACALGILSLIARVSAWAASITQTFPESLALSTAWACATASTSFLVLALLPFDGTPIALALSVIWFVGLLRALLGVPAGRALLIAGVYLPTVAVTLIAGGAVAGVVVDRVIRP